MTQIEFIPYEQARDLEKLDFNEPCLGRYCIFTEFEKPTGRLVLQKIDCSIHESLWLTKAPLYQQAFSFFRKKYGLHVIIDEEIRPQIKDSNGKLLFEYTKDGKYAGFEYEEVELACLIKLIEIVKQQ